MTPRLCQIWPKVRAVITVGFTTLVWQSVFVLIARNLLGLPLFWTIVAAVAGTLFGLRTGLEDIRERRGNKR